MSADILGYLAKAQDGVFAVDMEQGVVFWNQSAERILGYSASEVLGNRGVVGWRHWGLLRSTDPGRERTIASS